MADNIFHPNRSGLDIKVSLLTGVRGGYKNLRLYTNTNDSQFKKHLSESKDFGFVRKNGNGLEITEKGEKFLNAYEGLTSLMC